MAKERLAIVQVTAVNAKGTMKDHLNQAIMETVSCSTDIPADALGEAVAAALRRAWTTGIDPALEKGFYLKVEFT